MLALVLWIAISSVGVQPHYLSYFNEIAGGSAGGAEHLVDSNLDWGQDLLFLKHWLDGHPEARPLGLAYFNLVDPRVAGIEFQLPPPLPPDSQKLKEKELRRVGPQPGYFAVSVHFERGGSFLTADGKGQWRLTPLQGYAYFQHFLPVARAGYSIKIYHLGADQVAEVRQRLGLP